MGPCDTGWIGAMGLIHRGMPQGRPSDPGWIGAMGLNHGGS